MWFSKKQGVQAPPVQRTTKAVGDAAEALALAHLRAAGCKLLQTNYRTPGRGGGEIDLVMQDKDGTLVFVEVRHRTSASHGGAGASISPLKQRRIVFAARYYLTRLKSIPPCRFDVVLISGALTGDIKPSIEWLRSAFDAA